MPVHASLACEMAIHPGNIVLDPDPEVTLQSRLKRAVVEGILSGRFRRGERMPSSRGLAAHLGLSRITVTIAYTDLVADDWLTAKGRSGYFVSRTAPTLPNFALPDRTEEGFDWSPLLSHLSTPPPAIPRPADWPTMRFPFIYGQVDPALFDHLNWRACALAALSPREVTRLGADHYERDDPMLIDAILRSILPRRGIRAGPENILVTMGAQNALWLVARLLLTRGRTAVIERPAYPGIREALSGTPAHIAEATVDSQGLDPDALPDRLDTLFLTPSHHCPTNARLSDTRRRTILDRAEAEGFAVIEDDYEFDLALGDVPRPALKALDTTGGVIHVGSFSKSLFPGLRLGYMVASPRVIEAARTLRGAMLRHPPWHLQRTAAHFLSLGHYDAQVARMRRAFHARRMTMRDSIKRTGLELAQSPDDGGTCFWMKAPGTDTDDLARRLVAHGVLIEPGRAFFSLSGPKHYFRLAYSSIAASRIAEGIDLIARELD